MLLPSCYVTEQSQHLQVASPCQPTSCMPCLWLPDLLRSMMVMVRDGPVLAFLVLELQLPTVQSLQLKVLCAHPAPASWQTW